MMINQIRNKFAHHLTFRPNTEELSLILTLASQSFTDMTDRIAQGLAEIKGKKKIEDCEEWVVPELFVQISYDLHSVYMELRGDIEEF